MHANCLKHMVDHCVLFEFFGGLRFQEILGRLALLDANATLQYTFQITVKFGDGLTLLNFSVSIFRHESKV